MFVVLLDSEFDALEDLNVGNLTNVLVIGLSITVFLCWIIITVKDYFRDNHTGYIPCPTQPLHSARPSHPVIVIDKADSLKRIASDTLDLMPISNIKRRKHSLKKPIPPCPPLVDLKKAFEEAKTKRMTQIQNNHFANKDEKSDVEDSDESFCFIDENELNTTVDNIKNAVHIS
jgi:hypothetical protein